ncbi:hypothetical protein [Herminiimonas arsenitoxidans]|uniref:hypothetical protein n=1 Tax=Herminiimonas arsenitoxidans TaxID=1809410 RepID=UPI0012FFB440|nr:hypothetical protein [Herminiimonas arsenitoxidans]
MLGIRSILVAVSIVMLVVACKKPSTTPTPKMTENATSVVTPTSTASTAKQ